MRSPPPSFGFARVLLPLLSLASFGCLDSPSDLRAGRNAAFYYGNQTNLVLPFYTADDDAWATLESEIAKISNDYHLITVIVNGSNSGPDDFNSPAGQKLSGRINFLESSGVTVLGYVNNATPHVYEVLKQPDQSHSFAETMRETNLWLGDYYASGVFFDLSWRNDADVNDHDLANAELLTETAASPWAPATFNWSVPKTQAQHYMDCMRSFGYLAFMIEETDQADWPMYYSSWDWIRGFPARNFIDVVNSSAEAYAASDFDTMRQQRNAAGFFVTDRADYNGLPNNWQLFLDNINHDGLTYSDYPGPAENPPFASGCPDPGY